MIALARGTRWSENVPRRRVERIGDLVGHPQLARDLGVSPAMIRFWVVTGAWPFPRAVSGTTYYFRDSEADCWLHTGRWPDGARFQCRTRRTRH
jgi:hypothetical protein